MTYVEEQDISDIPDYPPEWTPEQRVAAYWHALHFTHMPGDERGWWAVWKSLEREQQRRKERA